MQKTSKKTGAPHRRGRQKISTTLAPENYQFLRRLAKRRLTTLAGAVDRVVEEARRTENRMRLAQQTEDYFAALSTEAREEENDLAEALSDDAAEVDFERG